MINSITKAFGSPFRHVQGSGEFNHLPEYSKPYGKACVITDSFLYIELNQKSENTYGESEGEFLSICFKGECCDDEVQRTRETTRGNGVAPIVGVGGGKTPDTVKLCADSVDLPVIIVPTSASTDAPVSEIAVLHITDGEYIGSRKMKHNVHLVLMDNEIIVKAPKRLFVVDMGNALATYPKALVYQGSDSSDYIAGGRRRRKAGMVIAKSSWDTLLSDGRSALTTSERGVTMESSENVIEVNTLLSGFGFLNTRLTTAHGIHPGLTMIPSTHRYLHGEKVTFGIVCQMVMENTPAETVDKAMCFMVDIGLPATLKQLDVEPIEENTTATAKKTVDGPLVHQGPVFITEKIVYDAILVADELGKKYRGM